MKSRVSGFWKRASGWYGTLLVLLQSSSDKGMCKCFLKQRTFITSANAEPQGFPFKAALGWPQHFYLTIGSTCVTRIYLITKIIKLPYLKKCLLLYSERHYVIVNVIYSVTSAFLFNWKKVPVRYCPMYHATCICLIGIKFSSVIVHAFCLLENKSPSCPPLKNELFTQGGGSQRLPTSSVCCQSPLRYPAWYPLSFFSLLFLILEVPCHVCSFIFIAEHPLAWGLQPGRFMVFPSESPKLCSIAWQWSIRGYNS